MFGISLYQQKTLELRPEGRRSFDARALFDAQGLYDWNSPYLSQIPCSWGAVYFPEHWREFHTFLISRFSESPLAIEELIVPDVRSNRWTMSWKKIFIELVYLRGYVMLYPNYADFVSLSTNHLEVGSHVKDIPRDIYHRKKTMFNLPLMQLPESSESHGVQLLDLPHGQMPPWDRLPVLDLIGTLKTLDELEERGVRRLEELLGCPAVGRHEPGNAFNIRELFVCDNDV